MICFFLLQSKAVPQPQSHTGKVYNEKYINRDNRDDLAMLTYLFVIAAIFSFQSEF